MEYLRKTGSKTVLWTIFVSLMTIVNTTALPKKGEDIEQGRQACDNLQFKTSLK